MRIAVTTAPWGRYTGAVHHSLGFEIAYMLPAPPYANPTLLLRGRKATPGICIEAPPPPPPSGVEPFTAGGGGPATGSGGTVLSAADSGLENPETSRTSASAKQVPRLSIFIALLLDPCFGPSSRVEAPERVQKTIAVNDFAAFRDKGVSKIIAPDDKIKKYIK
jgi:hypothetical protein